MHTVVIDRILPALVFFTLFLPFGTAAETLRDRSTVRFSHLEWIAGNNTPAREIPGANLPGGNETFPVLGRIQNDTSVSPKGPLYPRESRLGILDYREADPDLISLLRSVAVNLEKSGLDAALCDASRPFLPVVAAFQLAKLPPVRDVLFSRPAEGGENSQTALFRLHCLQENALVPVYLTVTASQSGSVWKVTELMFDAETYAGLAQPY